MCVGRKSAPPPPRVESSGTNIQMSTNPGADDWFDANSNTVSGANTGSSSTTVNGTNTGTTSTQNNSEWQTIIKNQQAQIDKLNETLVANQQAANNTAAADAQWRAEQAAYQQQMLDKETPMTATAKGFAPVTMDQASPDANTETAQASRRKKAKGKRGLQIRRSSSASVRGGGSGLNIPKG